jgi:phage baseplate assembly protein V
VFRVGIVKIQDVQTARVRVAFPDRNQLVSWWLPIVTPKSQNDKAYWIPDVGEQVVCFMDEYDEDGAVLGAIYSQVDTTPVQSADKWHITMQDGSTFEYDRSNHTFAINIAPNSSTLDIIVNGPANLTVQNGDVNLSAVNGNITLKTNEHSDSVNGIIDMYNQHTHPMPGGTTGVPNQQMT